MVLVTTKYAYCDSILQKPVLLLQMQRRMKSTRLTTTALNEKK